MTNSELSTTFEIKRRPGEVNILDAGQLCTTFMQTREGGFVRPTFLMRAGTPYKLSLGEMEVYGRHTGQTEGSELVDIDSPDFIANVMRKAQEFRILHSTPYRIINSIPDLEGEYLIADGRIPLARVSIEPYETWAYKPTTFSLPDVERKTEEEKFKHVCTFNGPTQTLSIIYHGEGQSSFYNMFRAIHAHYTKHHTIRNSK